MFTVNFSREDFIDFCREFEERNHFEFDETGIVDKGDDHLVYEATYRDADNYKSPVTFTLNEGEITWDVAYGWTDAYEEIEELYQQKVREMLNSEGIYLRPTSLLPFEIRRLYCPYCGSKALETSGDAFHLDPKQFENNRGKVDRYVCNCCNQEIYVPESFPRGQF